MKKIRSFLLTKSLGFYLNVLAYFNSKKAQQKVFELFSTPRKGKLNPNELPNFLKNQISQTLQFKNQTIQTYTWQGNDEIILLIHGWESNTSRWKKMLPHLKKTGKTIVAFDAPAQGLSSGTELTLLLYADCIQEMIQKIKPNYIIAHSLGGASVNYNQFKNPNPSLNAMVLLGAPSDINIIFENYFNLLSLNLKNRRLFNNFVETNYNIVIDNFKGCEFAKQVYTKTLVVHDKHDKIVLFDEGEKFENNFKNGTFIATENLGHSLHNDKLYQTIVEFLEN